MSEPKYRITPTEVLYATKRGDAHYEKLRDLVYYINERLVLEAACPTAPPGVLEFLVQFEADGTPLSDWILQNRHVQYEILRRYRDLTWLAEMRETATGGLLLCLRAP